MPNGESRKAHAIHCLREGKCSNWIAECGSQISDRNAFTSKADWPDWLVEPSIHRLMGTLHDPSVQPFYSKCCIIGIWFYNAIATAKRAGRSGPQVPYEYDGTARRQLKPTSRSTLVLIIFICCFLVVAHLLVSKRATPASANN